MHRLPYQIAHRAACCAAGVLLVISAGCSDSDDPDALGLDRETAVAGTIPDAPLTGAEKVFDELTSEQIAARAADATELHGSWKRSELASGGEPIEGSGPGLTWTFGDDGSFVATGDEDGSSTWVLDNDEIGVKVTSGAVYSYEVESLTDTELRLNQDLYTPPRSLVFERVPAS